MRYQMVFHNYVKDVKDEMFDGAADVILTRLAAAAEAVGRALGESLSELAEKVRIHNIVVLTEAH